jgi:hypothetical protein
VVTPELVQPIPAGVQPQVATPSPFLKDGPAKLPDSNQPDSRELPKQPQIPFEPSSNKSAQPANVPGTSLSNDIKGVIRNKDMQP